LTGEQDREKNNKNFMNFNPFVAGTAFWQSLATYWSNACGEFLKNTTKMAEGWYEIFWKPWLNLAPRERQQQRQSRETSATIDITKAMDTSVEIIDIMNTPDVATWNKGMQIKGDTAEVDKRSKEAERTAKTTPTAKNTGLRKNGSKDFIIDSADKKDVAKAVKSEATLTDEADLS
jgi:hypothetical protein